MTDDVQHPMPPKRRLWLWLIPLLMFIGLAILLGSRLGKDPAIQVSQMLNQPIPSFELPNLSDGQLLRQTDLPQQPYLLNVWGSWCPSCYVEHPILLDIAAQGVPIVGVNYKDEQADALAYLAKHRNPFVLNVQDEAGSLGLDLGLTGAPETFVVDAAGIVRIHLIGVIDQDNWTTRLKPCLDALTQSGDASSCR
ncbi:MAG: DsbE family thiol:disulfide interchange protein [Pseudomonadota bacterium]|nr:DsbE family thiol:disulfide interchange protein [Pseudomonadota bacterium]